MNTKKSKLPAQPVKGLLDGVEVLYELAAAAGPISCRELAERLRLEPTRVNRILKTFDHLGVSRRTLGRRYEPGPAIHVLAARGMVGSGLLRRALPVLERLSANNQYLVALGVLWRDSVSYFYHRGSIGVPLAEALARPMHPASRSSIGMALLAEKSEAEIRIIYAGREAPRFADIAELLEGIAVTRERGYGLVVEDRHLSVAVPIGEPGYAGLAFSSLAPDVDIAAVVCELRTAATAIADI